MPPNSTGSSATRSNGAGSGDNESADGGKPGTGRTCLCLLITLVRAADTAGDEEGDKEATDRRSAPADILDQGRATMTV